VGTIPVGSNQRLWNWYFICLYWAKQTSLRWKGRNRLVGSESV